MNKILVIEDEAAVRKLTLQALQSKGYIAIVAEDGETGVEIAKRELPDLILCDIGMPRMDGYATLAALRQDPVTAAIPFIFLTGLTDRSNIRQGMQLGADDYLTKPFTIAELLASVEARLKKLAEVKKLSERKLEDLRANISLALPHELLTPLNGILGFSTMLVEAGDSLKPAEVVEFAQAIHVSACRLQRLIENFLIYSQIELIFASPQKVAEIRDCKPVAVGALVGAAAHQQAERAKRASDLKLEIEDVHLPLSGENLEKTVEELAENAFKFSAAGTPVVVRTQRQSGTFVLSVCDQGRGMTQEQIRSVGAHMQFGRRLHEQQGSGLGLIIAKRLVELHGGKVLIESEPGKQTTVRIEFALPPSQAAAE